MMYSKKPTAFMNINERTLDMVKHLKNQEEKELDFVQPHNKINVTLHITDIYDHEHDDFSDEEFDYDD